MVKNEIKIPHSHRIRGRTYCFWCSLPDLPGCFSAGDSLEEAIENSKEAIATWIEITLDAGGEIPVPGELSDHQKNPEFTGWMWAVVEIDEALSA